MRRASSSVSTLGNTRIVRVSRANRHTRAIADVLLDGQAMLCEVKSSWQRAEITQLFQPIIHIEKSGLSDRFS